MGLFYGEDIDSGGREGFIKTKNFEGMGMGLRHKFNYIKKKGARTKNERCEGSDLKGYKIREKLFLFLFNALFSSS